MKYLPILSELFSSDSVIFLVAGLVVAFALGMALKAIKKTGIGMMASVIVYALCEALSNVPAYLVEIITVYIGTIAIGCFVGFLISYLVLKTRKA